MPIVTSAPVLDEDPISNFVTPMVIPKAKEGETKQKYVLAVIEDAPFEYENVGNLTFHKYLLPPEAFYSHNQGKHFPFNILTQEFTKDQAEVIRKTIQERSKKIARRRNPEFTPDNGQEEYLDEEFVPLSRYLIFCTVEEYKTGKYEENMKSGFTSGIDEGYKETEKSILATSPQNFKDDSAISLLKMQVNKRQKRDGESG